MKKRVFLLLTLMVSLFIYSDRVDAIEELTCIYGDEGDSRKMIVRDSDGNVFIYGSSDKNWFLEESNDTNSLIREQMQSATACYKNIEYPCFSTIADVTSTIKSHYEFYNEIPYDPYNCSYKSLNKQLNEIPKISQSHPIDDTVNVEETYNGMCTYKHVNRYNTYSGGPPITIFFNDERVDYKCLSDVVELDFDADEFLRFYKGYCPPTMYEGAVLSGQDIAYWNYSLAPISIRNVNNIELSLVESKYFNDYNNRIIEENVTINDCKDLIGNDVYEKLNYYFRILRIVIPILLIAFGILDFTKAIFGNEEDMNKARKKFIMRIVASILFFLLPIFLKLILSIANTVWNDINPETCISTNK